MTPELPIYHVTKGNRRGYTYPVEITQPSRSLSYHALVDTGASSSCINEKLYRQLSKNPLENQKINLIDASGGSLAPIGTVRMNFWLGHEHFDHHFVVCKGLRREMILGLEFLRKYRIGTTWTLAGERMLTKNEKPLAIALEEINEDQGMYLRYDSYIPPRTIAVVETQVNPKNLTLGSFYRVKSLRQNLEEHPNIVLIPAYQYNNLPKRDRVRKITVPLMLVNLQTEPVLFEKGRLIAQLENTKLEINDIMTEQALYPEYAGYQFPVKMQQSQDKNKIITSPADVSVHRKVDLADADISEQTKELFKQICEDYRDIFSTGSSDIGQTSLITMEVETGDHKPICQKPYNLPLKHQDWVKQELDILEKAGIITRSMSPWASPIVIVPKKSEKSDEPPRRRMCVDYRALNKLLPPVKKVNSNAKGVLSLVPLPKIDEIYAKLRNTCIYSTLDLRSGYHHITLSPESQPKTAFVTPMGKYQFSKVPFGLAQAPAYFQQLINKVLANIIFAFGYLDDIIIFSSSEEEHLCHLETVFRKLREANLKLKESKCNFLKRHIQYLGHLISGQGVKPLHEKLESMKSIPPPTTVKEVRQYLGLVGYYRKFVPRFSDIARPLTNLTKKNVDFIWTDKCQHSFEMLRELLMEEPVLKYPDPNRPYKLFTDASKYAWACVLTQEYKYHKENDKSFVINHPITYQSGLFKGSQVNWATLTKEAYAIYISVKKLSFYLEDAQVIICTDHRPLIKFLEKETLNNKVNNWAMELEGKNMQIIHIQGIKNTLADTMSRLITIEPDLKLAPEPPGYEFGYYVFEDLPNVQVNEINIIQELELGIPMKQMIEMQEQDSYCKNIRARLDKDEKSVDSTYLLKENVLYKLVTDNQQTFEALIVPKTLQPAVLKLVHDDMGHNGSKRTYMALKRLYYWKGVKGDTTKYVRSCRPCQEKNRHIVKYAKLHFRVPTLPMQFISMDLIGNFPRTAKGNTFALTAVCMLTGYVFCIPLKDKSAQQVINAYVNEIYGKYGGSMKILTDNGTEFKNKLFEEVAKQLGVEYKTYTAPYHPQSNGRIEGFHSFLKACMSKHITTTLEWDEVIPLACSAYNFMPNEHSKESPFFLMFGRDPLLPINSLLQPKIRYLGDEQCLLSLEALKNMYEIVARNLQKARQQSKQTKLPTATFKVNDLVLIKNHTAGSLEPKYVGDYRVVKFVGNQVEVMHAKTGKIQRVHITDIKYILPAENIVRKLPDATKFGRKTKLRINVDQIPNLNWQLATHTTSITQGKNEQPAQVSTVKTTGTIASVNLSKAPHN